jgi:glycosyltransferase involved in cell wall biosynthesis
MSPLSATELIPAHNEAATIEAVVTAIHASTYPIDRIIVADACTDNTAELARGAGAEVHLTNGADKGAARTRSWGPSAATWWSASTVTPNRPGLHRPHGRAHGTRPPGRGVRDRAADPADRWSDDFADCQIPGADNDGNSTLQRNRNDGAGLFETGEK